MPHGFVVDPPSESFDAKKIVMNGCEDVQLACDARSNLRREAVFHAVYIPPDNKDSMNVEGKSWLKQIRDV